MSSRSIRRGVTNNVCFIKIFTTMIIKKPSELEVKTTLTCIVYGQPGIGKTTLACSAPSPVLLDYDGGVSRMNGAHQVDTVQIHSWEDTEQALEEIRKAGCYRTIIIDTVGKLLAYMEDYIKRTQPRLKQNDGSLSLKGYGVRKQMFLQLLKDVSVTGMNIIFVAHEREERQGDETRVRPEISGSAASDLVKEMELVGYMQAIGTDRTITFDPAEKYYTKNTCNMHGIIKVPEVVDSDGNAVGENTFFTKVVEAYQAQQRANIEQNKVYEAQVKDAKERVAAVESAADANDFVAWVKEQKWVNNAKAIAGRMIAERAKELGLKLNKSKGAYEA